MATLIDYYVINLPFAILPGLSAIMFYALGDFLRFNKNSLSKWLPMLLFFGFICSIVAVSFSHIWMVQCSYGMYPVDIAAGCFGTFVTYIISQFIASKCKNVSKFLIWCGQNSLTILCLHLLELRLPVWRCLHVPSIWWVLLLAKITFGIIGTIILYDIPFFRERFHIVRFSKS